MTGQEKPPWVGGLGVHPRIPAPPEPTVGQSALALTELTLQAKLLPNLVDSHHGGVPNFLQDIWQDFRGFCPKTEKSMIIQSWQWARCLKSVK